MLQSGTAVLGSRLAIGVAHGVDDGVLVLVVVVEHGEHGVDNCGEPELLLPLPAAAAAASVATSVAASVAAAASGPTRRSEGR